MQWPHYFLVAEIFNHSLTLALELTNQLLNQLKPVVEYRRSYFFWKRPFVVFSHKLFFQYFNRVQNIGCEADTWSTYVCKFLTYFVGNKRKELETGKREKDTGLRSTWLFENISEILKCFLYINGWEFMTNS